MRAGLAKRKGSVRPAELRDYPPEELPPVIDWHNVFDAFTRQEADLYSFLRSVRVEGRLLDEEEWLDGFCAILANEEWSDAWSGVAFEMAGDENWRYAVVPPPGARRHEQRRAAIFTRAFRTPVPGR